ncbi:MAG: hypothetical protein AAF408_07610 [Pseudomonadota bacterium]
MYYPNATRDNRRQVSGVFQGVPGAIALLALGYGLGLVSDYSPADTDSAQAQSAKPSSDVEDWHGNVRSSR